MAKGYYSLIQYCPDAGRAEAANVGVLLYCPEKRFLDAKVSAGNDRIRRFFRGQEIDLEQINAVKRAIVRRLHVERSRFESVSDLEKFVATRANQIQLTAPRPMQVQNPVEELNELFVDYVGGRSHREKRGPVLPELDQALRRPDLEAVIQFEPAAVTIPVLNRPLRVPYAYRNGALNLIQPHVFGADDGQATRSAMNLAVEGDLLQRHSSATDPMRLIVVAAFKGAREVQTERISELFREYRVECVPTDRISDFVSRIETEAH